MFRSQILPALIALWGAALVLNIVISGPDGSGAYASGQLAAGVLGAVMLFAGVRAVRKARATAGRTAAG
jgi:hypothetical protein